MFFKIYSAVYSFVSGAVICYWRMLSNIHIAALLPSSFVASKFHWYDTDFPLPISIVDSFFSIYQGWTWQEQCVTSSLEKVNNKFQIKPKAILLENVFKKTETGKIFFINPMIYNTLKLKFNDLISYNEMFHNYNECMKVGVCCSV